MNVRLAADGRGAVADPSDAGAIYGRGFFGTVGDDGLSLDRAETVYLSEMGRIVLVDEHDREVPWTEALRRAVRAEPEFAVPYLVYRDLRQRGYVVRESPPPTRFAVLPRGGVLQKTPARFWVQPISERAPFDLGALLPLFDRAHAARKTLLLAVIDEESDLTYYRTSAPVPHGTRPPKFPPAPWSAWVSEDRVLVTDPTAVESLGREQGFGSRIGARLELSLVEAAFLGARGALTFRAAGSHRPLEQSALLKRASRIDPDLPVRLATYGWLREQGLIVKTGFKYGAHFRAYVRDPEHDHARYLVQAVPAGFRAPWPTLAGHVRLAQGVRKSFLLAAPAEDRGQRFFALERIRP